MDVAGWAMTLPDGIVVGARLRGVPRITHPSRPTQLAEVRWIEDDHAAIRWWDRKKWNYEMIDSKALESGRWSLE